MSLAGSPREVCLGPKQPRHPLHRENNPQWPGIWNKSAISARLGYDFSLQIWDSSGEVTAGLQCDKDAWHEFGEVCDVLQTHYDGAEIGK
jgi:hypothetical protein